MQPSKPLSRLARGLPKVRISSQRLASGHGLRSSQNVFNYRDGKQRRHDQAQSSSSRIAQSSSSSSAAVAVAPVVLIGVWSHRLTSRKGRGARRIIVVQWPLKKDCCNNRGASKQIYCGLVSSVHWKAARMCMCIIPYEYCMRTARGVVLPTNRQELTSVG